IARLPAEPPARTGLMVRHAPGEEQRGGLGYRTRIDLVADGAGRLGMFRFRSHEVLPVTQMPLAATGIELEPLLRRTWRPGQRIEAVAPRAGVPLVLAGGEPLRGKRRVVRERVHLPGVGAWADRVDGAGSWQAHAGARRGRVAAV